ncbi:MAG: diguanylate cyclase [Methylophilaceae bacterium]|nr:diguanylate cyclase [Methylophilaceae bacterium]
MIKENKLVYLIDEDVAFGRWVASQIHYYGYQVRGFQTLHSAAVAIKKRPPDAVVVSFSFAEDATAGAKFVEAMRKTMTEDIPAIFMSTLDDIHARLLAVRSGGKAFLTKPVDTSELVDWINRLTAEREHAPYQVLIVDDDKVSLTLYSKILRDAGMITREINDPMLVLESLYHFSPELILMDMYMPLCSGMELASVIRQQAAYIGIPIVFLSAETRLDVQMSAMREGGDDFLVKPIDAQHLIASIAARAERYRGLRSRMSKDSLTGLLNHGKLMEQLDFELARAMRNHQPLSFAMIDLDHFKKINDTYGHPVGDRVLKSVSQLLRDRLRKTDFIGRYGGEEFAVIMPDTAGVYAVGVLDEIRRAFSEIVHSAGNARFKCTFSCGVAEYDPKGPPLQNLAQKADETLYLAKRNGRNRVEINPL